MCIWKVNFVIFCYLLFITMKPQLFLTNDIEESSTFKNFEIKKKMFSGTLILPLTVSESLTAFWTTLNCSRSGSRMSRPWPTESSTWELYSELNWRSLELLELGTTSQTRCECVTSFIINNQNKINYWELYGSLRLHIFEKVIYFANYYNCWKCRKRILIPSSWCYTT